MNKICDGNCIKNLEAKIEEKFKDKEVKSVQISGLCYLFEKDFPGTAISIPLVVEVQEYKTNGDPKLKVTKKKMNLIPSYCGMCGGRIKKDTGDL